VATCRATDNKTKKLKSLRSLPQNYRVSCCVCGIKEVATVSELTCSESQQGPAGSVGERREAAGTEPHLILLGREKLQAARSAIYPRNMTGVSEVVL